MADILKLEIVTPTGVAFARDVSELSAPTISGEIGVLPGHVPMLSALRTGVITARPVGSGDDSVRFAIAHGVLEVSNDKAVVLTDKYSKKEDVDILRTRKRFKEVDEEIVAWSGEVDEPKRIELIEEEQWLAALLELIGAPPPEVMRELTRFKSNDEVHIVPGPPDTPEGLVKPRRE